MDATEITNNEYRQFVQWVRDSTAAVRLQYGKEVDGVFVIDWKKAKTIKWNDKATIEKMDQMILSPENRIFGKKKLTPTSLNITLRPSILRRLLKEKMLAFPVPNSSGRKM